MNNNCESCKHKQTPDGGHCYMFLVEPTGPCAQHSVLAHRAIAQRIQYGLRVLRDVKSKVGEK